MVHSLVLQQNKKADQPNSQRKKDQGFATLILLFFIPVTVTVFVVASAVATLANEQALREKHCNIHTLQTMFKVESNLNQLLQKNKTALLLRKRYQRTQILLGAAVAVQNYPRIAYYTAKLAQIYSQRMALDLWQKSKINEAETDLQKGKFVVKKITKTRVRTSNPELDLLRDAPGLAPQYFTSPLFVTKIPLGANYSFQIQNVFPKVILSTMTKLGIKKNYTIHGQCRAGLEMRGGLWRATIKI